MSPGICKGCDGLGLQACPGCSAESRGLEDCERCRNQGVEDCDGCSGTGLSRTPDQVREHLGWALSTLSEDVHSGLVSDEQARSLYRLLGLQHKLLPTEAMVMVAKGGAP